MEESMNPPHIPHRLRILLATALLFSITALYAQHNANVQSLDDFLSGFDDECIYSAELKDFRSNLRAGSDQGVFTLTPKAAKSRLSPGIRESFGSITVTEENEDYQIITVEVNGYWDGVEVKNLEFLMGKESGWSSVAVNFAPPSSRAMSVFEARILRSAERMKNDPDNEIEASTGIDKNGDSVRIWCDWST